MEVNGRQSEHSPSSTLMTANICTDVFTLKIREEAATDGYHSTRTVVEKEFTQVKVILHCTLYSEEADRKRRERERGMTCNKGRQLETNQQWLRTSVAKRHVL